MKRWKVVAPRKGSVASTRVGAQGMMSTRIAEESSTDIVEQYRSSAQDSALCCRVHQTVSATMR